MSCRENISYLVPRDPSIKCWSDRVKLPAPWTKNLIELSTDEFEETMGDKIKVYLRLKPSVTVDNPYTVLSSKVIQTEAPKDSVAYKNVANGIGNLIHKFTFTSVLDQHTTQAELFKKCVVKSLKTFLSGENYLLMAYGTTSAGKTYTMQGNVENPGVIPRALDFLFTALEDGIIAQCKYTPYQFNDFKVLTEEQSRNDQFHKNFILSLDLTKCQRYPDVTQVTFDSNPSSYENSTFQQMKSNLEDTETYETLSDTDRYSVWVSMIEIYNEQVYDLLDVLNDKGKKPKLAFRDDGCGNTYVQNLRYVNVSTVHEAFQVLQFGRNNLHFAPTALNNRSSRSHCIFNVTLAKFPDYDNSSQAVISRFSFCDLAGMERAKKTLNIKERLVESKAINTSLSILVKCLTTIKENQTSKEKKMIPYRESKLTKFFRDAVTGKEQFSLIVNVTTQPNLFDETLNVLRFSAIAQKIVPQNVLVRPKLVKLAKRSRFSRIVTSSKNSGMIDWEASMEPETKVMEESSGISCSNNNNSSSSLGEEVEELRELVESLRGQLAEEKKRCEQIEADIREELTKKFSEMLRAQYELHRVGEEREREMWYEMQEKRDRRLARYYEIMMKRNKRPKFDDDPPEDNKIRLQEVESEVEGLKGENQSLKEEIRGLLEERNRLVLESSELKFKMAEKERAVEALERANRAEEEGGGELEKELRKQLNEANAKISNFKSLLAEAASDFESAEERNKLLEDENKSLEERLAEHVETVDDLRRENSELEKMLSQKRIAVEKLEQAIEDLREERKPEAETAEREKETAEKRCRELEAEVESLQKEVKRLLEEKARLDGERLDLETLARDKEDSRGKEVLRLKKSNSELEDQLKEFKSVESTSKTELDSLRVKFEAVECQNSAMKDEVVHLQEEVRRLEKEVENREKDMKSFNENRELIFNNLEKELTWAKEENERLRKDVFLTKEIIAKTITPVKTNKAEMKKLRDSVRKREEEINKLKAEVESLKKKPESVKSQTSLEETSSRENSPFRMLKKKKEEGGGKGRTKKERGEGNGNGNVEKLTRQVEELSIVQPSEPSVKSTRKKVDLLDETVHPSTIKAGTKGGRRKKEKEKEEGGRGEEEKENTPVGQKGRCHRKLFTENDFNELVLNGSPSEKTVRLRPRK